VTPMIFLANRHSPIDFRTIVVAPQKEIELDD